MRSPGFEIFNDTIWPMQVALKQAGPLYWGLVEPGKYFHRNTGAVWFTIQATVSLDGKLHITTKDAIWPVAAIVGSVALGALTGGYGAFVAAGTAAASVGGVSTANTCGAGSRRYERNQSPCDQWRRIGQYQCKCSGVPAGEGF